MAQNFFDLVNEEYTIGKTYISKQGFIGELIQIDKDGCAGSCVIQNKPYKCNGITLFFKRYGCTCPFYDNGDNVLTEISKTNERW